MSFKFILSLVGITGLSTGEDFILQGPKDPQKGESGSTGREGVYQTVQIHTAICPEYGRVYVSGGKTTTVTRAKPNPEAYLGKNIDREL